MKIIIVIFWQIFGDLKWDNSIIDVNHNPVLIDFDKTRKVLNQGKNEFHIKKILVVNIFLAPEQYFRAKKYSSFGIHFFIQDIFDIKCDMNKIIRLLKLSIFYAAQLKMK